MGVNDLINHGLPKWTAEAVLDEVAAGVNPPEVTLFTDLYSSSVLIAAQAEVVSGWFDFQTSQIDTLLIAHTREGGTYVFEVDWSIDGITVAVTEEIVGAGSNNTSVTKTVATRYGRVRIRNTHLTDAFTTHLTVVTGRSH